MTPAEGIRKHGFRTWYERQLIESHVYFITAFMCMVLIMALLEDLNLRGPGPLSKVTLAFAVGAAVVTLIAMRAYLVMLMRAEFLAGQCVCAQCRTYGLIMIQASGNVAEEPQWLRVACRRCGHEWRMEPYEKN